MIHVYPIEDIEEHELEGTQCWCCPEIREKYGQFIIVHNAFDGRTLKEKENEQS